MASATEIFTENIKRISRTEIDAAYFSMSPERRKRCDSLKFQSDKDLCIVSDMLLRRVLSERLGILPESLVFGVSDKGKPHLCGGGYFFSVSHSGDIAAVAVNKAKETGIDVEKIRPVNSRIAKRIFSESDIRFVFGDDTVPDGEITDREALVRFFKVWTYKEAFVKMTGEGITDNIRNYSYNENGCLTEIFDDYVLTVITSE